MRSLPLPACCRLAVLWLLVLSALPLPAQVADSLPPCRVSRHTWLFGAGTVNLLDTYLSPLEYTGPNLTLLHRRERPVKWGGGKLTALTQTHGHVAYAKSPTDDGKEWDGELSVASGWLCRIPLSSRWRLSAGALGELTSGFTYNTRGSNNPAQGRLGLSLLASAVAEGEFRLWKKTCLARFQADAHVAGLQFAPEYGQSYYEIFSLGHTSGIVHPTWTGNCPTARLEATVSFPTGRNRWTFGYVADIRQSSLGGLKRHAWRHNLVVGYAFRCFKL